MVPLQLPLEGMGLDTTHGNGAANTVVLHLSMSMTKEKKRVVL